MAVTAVSISAQAGFTASGNTIAGNYIGTNVTGSAALANSNGVSVNINGGRPISFAIYRSEAQ